MKRRVGILLIFFFFLSSAAVFLKPLAVFFTKKQLEKIFVGASVSIGGCNFNPLRSLAFRNVEIKKGQIYDFQAQEAGIRYDLSLFFKKNIAKFYLRDAEVSLRLPRESILGLKNHLNLGSGDGFLLKTLELSNLSLDLESSDMNVRANLSLELNLAKKLAKYFEIRADYLEASGFKAVNVRLRTGGNLTPGDFSAESLEYDKIKIKEAKSRVRLENNDLFFESLSAKTLEGMIEGSLAFKIDKGGEYLADLKFTDLDLSAFTEDFNLEEKFRVSGRLGGVLNLSGLGDKIKILKGDFFASDPGGRLEIKDSRFLEKMARNSGQALDIVVESFKNYRYNNAIMKTYIDQGDFVLDIALSGETGKRNLNIVLHDFKLWKEGP